MRWLARFARWFVAAMGAIALLTAVAYAKRDKPLLYRLEEKNCACLVPATVAILNPFRDRSPELPATKLLGLLQQDKCEAAVGSIGGAVYPTEFCTNGISDVRPHVIRWSLRDRVDSRQEIRLTYTVHFAGQSGSWWLWFRIRPEGRGWKALYMGNEVPFY